jgi:hypothetical protein
MASLAAAVLIGAFFAPAIFSGQVPTYRDFVNVFLPYKLHAAHALDRGLFPLWATEPALGAPFHASYQAGLLYPPAGIVWLFPSAFGIGLYLALHAWLGAFGMERLLARRGVSTAPRLLAAIVYALGGFFVSALPWGHGVVAAWLPLGIVAAEDVVRAPSRGRFLRLVAVLALQILGGAPEAFAQSAVLVCASAWIATGALSRGRRAMLVGAAAALATTIAAAQLLPTGELLGASERVSGLGRDVVMLFSFEPASFLTFLDPHRIAGGVVEPIPEHEFPLVWSVYVGLVPLLFAALGAATWRGRRFSALLAVSLLLALGRHGLVFPLAYRAAPGLIGLFRYPEKFLLGAHFALAVLAAVGLCRWQSSLRRRTRLPVGALSLVLCTLAAADLWAVHRPALLFTDFASLIASAPPAVLGKVAPDVRLFHYEREGPSLEPWNPKFAIGDDLGAFRRAVWADLGANVGLAYGVGFVADAAGLRQESTAALYRYLRRIPAEQAIRLLRVLGVRFLVGPDAIDSEALQIVRRGGRGSAWIYRLRAPGTRIYLASRVRAVEGLESALDRLSDADFVPGEDATVAGDCPPIPACLRGPGGAEGPRVASLRTSDATPEEIRVDVTVSESSLLVVNDSLYPGWRATVDGRAAPILRANGLVRGVVVPPGSHSVSFRYAPVSFRIGLVASAIGLAGAMLLAEGVERRLRIEPTRPRQDLIAGS